MTTTQWSDRCEKAPMPMTSDTCDMTAIGGRDDRRYRGRRTSARASSASRIRGLLTGQGVYDRRHAARDALHVAFRRSDHAHARIVGIDARRRAELPGVFGVFTRAGSRTSRSSRCAPSSRMQNYHATAISLLGARQGALCRRTGRRRAGREPLPRRGRARADRDRLTSRSPP